MTVGADFARRKHNLIAVNTDIGLQTVSLLLRAPYIRNCHMLDYLNSIIFARIVAADLNCRPTAKIIRGAL